MTGELSRGDCLEILPTLPEASVQLALTSPPYNTGQSYGDDGSGDRLPLPEYEALLIGALAGCYRALRHGGVLVLNLPPSICVKRPDGTSQVTFNGKLLYTFYEDSPGEVGGDGFDDAFGGMKFTWHVVHANGSTSSQSGGDNGGSGIPGY